MRLYIVILSFLLTIIACYGQKIDKIRGSSWICVDYIKGMENHLPCECAGVIKEPLKDIIHHTIFIPPVTNKQDVPQALIDAIINDEQNNYCYYVSIASTTINEDDEDERIPEVIMNRIIETDGAREFYIISEDSNKYVIADNYEKWDSTIELRLNNDTLIVSDKIGYRKYIKYSMFFNTDYTGFVNVSLLNKALSLRAYPSIQTILKEDSLSLSCNGGIGNINVISSYKKRKSWILEISSGYLYIKKIINSGPDPLKPINTKLIRKLKWEVIK